MQKINIGETSIKPTELTSGDMSFNCYNKEGKIIGNNINGLNESLFKTFDEMLEFGLILDTKCQQQEIKIKFYAEFGMPIENIKDVVSCKDDIISIMVNKWNIPEDIMTETFTNYIN